MALAALFSTFWLGHLHEETPCALILNALRLPHSAKPHKRTSKTCPFGDRLAVSYYNIETIAIISQIYMRRTRLSKYDVLVVVSTRTY